MSKITAWTCKTPKEEQRKRQQEARQRYARRRKAAGLKGRPVKDELWKN